MGMLKESKKAPSKTVSRNRISVPRDEPEVAQFRLPEDMHIRIAQKAYGLFEQRGFVHGYDLQDWLEAEKQVIESFFMK